MIITILVVLGLCFGSFVNALVWRLYKQERSRSKSRDPKLSILTGRSMCPKCKHELSVLDLVPVFSYIWLRGKCRYCHEAIADSPLAELLTPALFVLSYVYWPLGFESKGLTMFVFWLVLLVGLVALALYDLKWYILPNKLTYSLLVIGCVQALLLVTIFTGRVETAWQLVGGLLIGGGLFYILFQVSKGRWIGGGDVKLGMLLGLILAQPSLAILMIFGASFLGTLVSIPLLALGKANKNSRIPFGPFLIAGAVIARLFGLSLIAWYKRQLGVQ